MTRKIFYLTALFASISFYGYGQSSRPLSMLEFNTDVRSAGMGDSFMGESKGMYIFTNPTSALYQNGKMYGNYSYSLFPKIEGVGREGLHAASFGYKIGSQVIYVGFRRLGGLKFTPVDGDGLYGKESEMSDLSVDLSYARSFGDHFSAYITGTFIQSIAGKTAYTGGVSLGAYYRNNFSLSGRECDYSLGLSASNFGGEIAYMGKGYMMPGSLALGGSVAIPVADKHKVGASLTGRYLMLPTEASSFGVGIGAEYTMYDMVSIRTGYHLGEANYLTLGLGAEIKFATIDLSYIMANENIVLNNMLRIGVGFRF